MSSTLTSIPQKPIKASTIFTFIPNLIGYSRVFTLIASFFTMKTHPIFTMGVLYSTSCLLDAFDGYAARTFNQSTKFGAVLDMVTDRCSTSSLIVFLAVLYPNWFIFWQLMISLDLASHYMHMYASLVSGSTSHKSLKKDTNVLLRLYYENRTVLFFVCALNELFYMALYLDHYNFSKLPIINISIPRILVFISLPIWFFKQFMNVIQLINASNILAEVDATSYNERNKLN
ncbi:hypothetical protein CANARDRAFT_214451 [[Candida] arabinofermentans NRRL YB-2248]|uniref:CDP-diacylglycerol--inositol 3-phosphatidyltransferase n=1 Tax=[Candida] arabinofermentans NRRL YB-2248 TaxID=983967 RepID=A0A1E4SVH6_9ASCO|nr:hypothetical protein CANARDRAFT_214451 [[Candida] arabinofermentans NRRL YB-2248]